MPDARTEHPKAPAWAQKTERALGVPAVRERVARYALNADTRARILATTPYTIRGDAEREHTYVREALVLHAKGAPLPIRQTNGLTAIFTRLNAGATISGAELYDCRACLQQASVLHEHTARHATDCPTLARAFSVPLDLRALIEPLRAALDEHGQLFDHASTGLQAARTSLSRAREALRQQQAELLRRHKSRLSGAYFAEREGRFVLPVRADAERPLGTILDVSASGNTLYVEPQELIELNNRLRVAEARVLQEEETLLRQLSELVRGRLEDLRAAADHCVEGDRIAAIATWAVKVNAVPIVFASEPLLCLEQVRHPLLIANDASGADQAVANDLELWPGRALILSGPNAGGKTVALTCLGLAAWLAKSGLPVPCSERSRIGWFDEVFADIGDDQSITRSLSTFSAHIAHLVHCVEIAREGALILLDEIAGGTDPDEGAALAEALLRALVATNTSIATTTHYPRLKQLAASNDRLFCNASVGFDLLSMQPTFRITMGIPGVSSGLAVAERFGIPAAIVAKAKELLPSEHRLQQDLLQQISHELDKTSANRDASDTLLRATQRKAEVLEAEHHRTLQNDRSALEKLRESLTQEVKQARADLMRAKNLISLQTKDSYREAESLVNRAALPITLEGNLTRALRPAERAELAQTTITPGMTVHIANLGAQGLVLEAPNKGQVRVSVGGLKMSVPLDQVRELKPTALQPKANAAKPSRQRKAAAPNYHGATRTTRNTCDLRGKRVDEGLREVEAFIDQMLQLDEPAAFVLHGHGTGAMKAAVREHLATSPVVRHFEAAAPEQGGDAFTVVWLS